MGSPHTDAEKVTEFRAHYLLTGNASKSARAVGLKERTGRALAEEADDDPAFAEQCRKARARALSAVTRMLVRNVERADERVESTYLDKPEMGTSDPTWQAARFIADAHKSLVSAEKLEAERSGEISTAAVVIMTSEPPDSDPPEGSPAPAAA